jgi:Uma2 family endonuclease
MTYCQGALEIMSPGPEHEEAKTIIARLVEMFALEREVPLLGYGSTTLRQAVTLHGLEPDECYCVGHRLTSVPDIAIEVVITSGGIEKLPVYQGLGVQEVWFWEDEAFHLFALRDAREEGGARGYERIPASELLKAIDLGVIAALVRGRDQLEAVRAYRAWLRG